MKLNCKVESPSKEERAGLIKKLSKWANCIEIGDAVFANYCGADKRLADSIIAVIEECRTHEITQSS